MTRAPIPSGADTTGPQVPVPGTEGSGDHRGARAVAAGLCGALAALLVTVSVLAVWARIVALDDSTASTIAIDAVADADVQAALSDYLADAVVEHLHLPNSIVDDVPDVLEGLEPALRAAVTDLVDRAFESVLESPEMPEIVGAAVERGYDAVLELLSGDGLPDGISVADGEVRINLLPLIARGLIELSDLGVDRLDDVPRLTVDGDPAEQIVQLEEATGRELDDDFGQLVVYRSDDVAQASGAVSSAQHVAVVATRALWILLGITVVLIGAAIALAPDRASAVLRLAAGVGVGMVIARIGVRQLVDEAPDLASRPAGRSVIEVVLDDLTPGLLRLSGAVLLVALIGIGVVAWIRGWRRDDGVFIGGVAAALAVLIVMDLHIWSLILAVAVAGVVWLLGPRLQVDQ